MSSLAFHKACGGSWLLAQSCFLLESCTAFICGLPEGTRMQNWTPEQKWKIVQAWLYAYDRGLHKDYEEQLILAVKTNG